MLNIEPMQNALNDLNRVVPGHVIEVELDTYDGVSSIRYSLYFVTEEEEDGRTMTELCTVYNDIDAMYNFLLGATYRAWI